MQVQKVKEMTRVSKTIYEDKEVEKTYYISDDGLKKSLDEYKIKNYEKSLIDDKIFNITPLEQFPENISDYYHCGFAFNLPDKETYQLFYKKYLENYSCDVSDVLNIFNRWFTYYTVDEGNHRDSVYFIFFDKMEEDINKTMSILNKFKEKKEEKE